MATEDSPDDNYTRAHELLDAARTALADIPLDEPVTGAQTRKVLGFLIEAVEASTFGWAGAEAEALSEEDPAPYIPSLRTLVIQGKNCVSALNEYAQQRGIEAPRYEFHGVGVFRCGCHFMGRVAESREDQRTKNDAKHDAAESMLDELRKESAR